MLSRLVVRGAVLRPSGLLLRSSNGLATEAPAAAVQKQAQTKVNPSDDENRHVMDPSDNPERDHVNFPRRKRPIYMPPVRLGFLPENWFKAFHDKTGVTGPYAFIFTVGTFALSKEYFVIEHEFYSGIALLIVWGGIAKYMGPSVRKYLLEEVEAKEAQLKAVRTDEIDRCLATISEEEKAQWMATSYEELMQAKQENVALQLEAAYRQRLQDAYDQVKRRLDYQVELGNVMRRIEQKHMADWIISGVKKSITPKQEDEALKKCVADLKQLARA